MMTSRRSFLHLMSATAMGLALGLPLPVRAAEQSLDFDPEGYEVLTEVVETAAGAVSVTYRFWRAVPYVSRPVDVAYQSLNVSVPVEIDGVAVDASGAPILFANTVGGYMPSSVVEAKGVGDTMPMRPPAGMAPPEGAAPEGMAEAPSGSAAMMAGGKRVSNAKLALAAGLVVVEPGARGRTLVDAAGVYYGTAPAAIVDLKAAVRYLRRNRGVIPGDMERIVSSGTSAGGALSALLAASGDGADYAPYLAEIGAAEESDAILAAGCWCPITDLEHADMAYEWNWGANPTDEGAVDAALAGELAQGFASYQAGLGLTTPSGAALTVDSYHEHLLGQYLRPEATAYLAAMTEAERAAYLAANPEIGFEGGQAVFDWTGFLAHVGPRKKGLPAFDAFDLSTGENNLFGAGTVQARHFTEWSLRRATGDAAAVLEADIPAKLRLMNPMHWLAEGHGGRARHWWLRVGAKDTDTSLTVVGNLEARLRGLGDAVDARFYWDEGHGANTDAAAFIDWIKALPA